MQVLVHKTKGKWRVYAQGTITEHDFVLLRDVTFVIVPELQAQVRESQKRVPHAYAMGELVADVIPEAVKAMDVSWTAFDYNAFEHDTFIVTDSQQPLTHARYVLLTDKETIAVI